MTEGKGIGRSLGWLVTASIAPIIAFSIGVVWLFADWQKAAKEAELSSLTRALSEVVDRELESSLSAMRLMATGHSLDGDDLSRFADRLDRVLANTPQWRDVLLIDPRSHLIVESHLPRPDPVPTGEVLAAVDAVIASGKSLIVGAAPVTKATGRTNILLMVPVRRADEVRYVLTVELVPEAISTIFNGPRLSSRWTGAVIDANGRIAGRSRDPEQYVGHPVSALLAEHLAANDQGLFPSISREGEKLYAVISRSDQTAWSVVVGIPSGEVDLPIHRTVIMVAAAGAIMAAISLALASVIGRYIVAQRKDYVAARDQAELLISREASRYQSLLKTASDGIHVLDEHGNLIEYSESFRHMLGYDEERMSSLNVRDWDVVFSPEAFDERMASHIAEPSVFETKHRRADGSIFDVEINLRGVEIEGRQLVYASARDITERKRLEEALRQSEERLRSLVEGTTDWVWETDADHRFVWLSNSAEIALGVSASDIIGKHRWDLAHQDRDIDATQWQGFMADLGSYRSFRDFRYWFKTRDGEAKWISVSGSPRFDAEGNFLGYRGSGSDITFQANAAMRLKMLSAVAEHSPLSVVLTDPNGNIEYVNPYFTIASGYPEDEVLGKNTRIFSSGKTPPEVFRDMWATISAGRRWAGELLNRRKDGTLHWEMMVIAAILDDVGQIIHYVSIKEDVTERHELQESLRRSNAELEQFAYVASHDMRQPLRMVESYLTLIERSLGNQISGEIKEFFDFAVGGARQMERMIRDLLEYSRVGKGAELVAVSLPDAISRAILNLTVAISESEAEVIVADALPTVMGDSIELIRLFQNLIGNAVKYRAPGRRPKVKIDCRRQDCEWLISVRDNGIGIAEGDRDRAFAIFQRLVPQGEYEGTGIGLAVCKKIVEHHGGRIWVESVPDEGSTFYLTLQDGTPI